MDAIPDKDPGDWRKPSGGGIISLFTRHPNAANLMMILMLVLGFFAVGNINTQFFPTVEIDMVNVSIKWPGASAEDVESNILQLVEPEVRFVDGVDEMVSNAREGSGTISLEFAPGTDMQKATADVDSAVKAISTLPTDSEAPRVSRIAFFDRVARISVYGDVPEATLRIYAKKIRDDLIDRGIDKIEFTGLRAPELQVEIPERELRKLGLSIGAVSQMIETNSLDMPSGQTEGKVEQQIRAVAEFKRPATLGEIEISSFESGEKVRLSEISEIKFGYEDGLPQGYTNGQRSIQLTVQRAPTADTLATAAILDNYLAELQGALPPRHQGGQI